MSYTTSQVAYWNERAKLGATSGTLDLVASELEARAIREYVRDGMRILEAGCGTGTMAIDLAREFDVKVTAFDLSPSMIERAKRDLGHPALGPLKGDVSFHVHDVRKPFPGTYDLVITKRCLINLASWEEQRHVIELLLHAASRYVMVENSLQGLAATNALRSAIGLPAIEPPWHNQYLDENLFVELSHHRHGGPVSITGPRYITSTYALLSRVVNAWEAAQRGELPRYDAPVNNLALRLPEIGYLGQTRLWVLERTEPRWPTI